MTHAPVLMNSNILNDNSDGLEDPSGLNEFQLDKIDAISSSASSFIRRTLKEAIEMLPISQALEATGLLKQKVVYVHYGDTFEDFNVNLKLWDAFLSECQERLDITGKILKVRS